MLKYLNKLLCIFIYAIEPKHMYMLICDLFWEEVSKCTE